ncbi:MAG TPA: glycosyltransferase family 4 protein [Candidatus Limnocylindria bacterium]|nr:glycosyltransferase family 4 protein [Candidatus Limnocylindria bacterium]
MRVTHVITRLIVGGAQENTIASVLGLRARPGLEVDLVSGPTRGREGSLESLVAEAGCLTVVPELVRPINPWADWLAYRHLTRLFQERQPQIVHTHSGKAGILGRLAAKKAGVPLIIHSIHGPSFGPFQGRLANAVFTTAERAAGRVTDHFVVVAHAMSRQYLAAGIGHSDDYTRIFSGFDLQPFLDARRDPALAAKLGIRDGDFVVGKIARLFKLKGHDELFAIAPKLVRRIPNIRFLLVGDGPWRPRFEALAATPELAGRFIFTGLVPPAEVPRHVALMDCLVHLSHREGLPRALPQALANGKPVIAYDCDGAGEICLGEQSGLLIPTGATRLLVSAIEMLASDPAYRRRLGEFGREYVRTRFTVERLVEEQHQLYLRLARDKGLLPAEPSPASTP